MDKKNDFDLNTIPAIVDMALPGSIIDMVSDSVDKYEVFHICPKPGILLKISVKRDSKAWVMIEKIILVNQFGSEYHAKHAEIYNGPLPKDESGVFHVGIIIFFLKNWMFLKTPYPIG